MEITAAEHIYVVCGRTDMRKSIDGLAAFVKQRFQLDSFSDSLFLFCGNVKVWYTFIMTNEPEIMETSSETVTISKTEYDALKVLKEQNAEHSQQVNWLMEQMRLSKHRQFASSNEKSEYDQLNFFNEAEANVNARAAEPELTAELDTFPGMENLI